MTRRLTLGGIGSGVGRTTAGFQRRFDRMVESRWGAVPEMARRRTPAESLPNPVTEALYQRLNKSDIEQLAALLDETDRAWWSSQEPGSVAWKRTALHYSVHYGLTDAIARTGLLRAEPPVGIHSMGRGPFAAGGSIYHADLVIGAIELIGQELPRGGSLLDFGCSSGRVVRVLKAYRPDLKCYGCDPNQQAILWAKGELQDIDFVVSDQRPPLELGDGSVDMAYAISIWSHFGPVAAQEWLAEMHRVLRPDGLLILTTHSFHSVAYYHQRRLRDLSLLRKTLISLVSTGFDFAAIFGTTGDWGVVNPEWGEAYISAEWLLNKVTPGWEVVLYRSGANEENQDVVVLRRR